MSVRLPGAVARLGRATALLWLLATVAFFSVRIAPGNALDPPSPSVPVAFEESQARLYGLDRPLARQYFDWMSGLTRGDLGWSFEYRAPVVSVLARVAPDTARLVALALAIQFLVGLAAAAAAARSAPGRSLLDPAAAIVHSLPPFWLALLLLTVPGVLALVPTRGDASAALVLPALVLGLSGAAGVYKLSLPDLEEHLRDTVALGDEARGGGSLGVLWRAGLRRSLTPAVERLPFDLPAFAAGALAIEVVFSRPGLGRAVHRAFLVRDLPLLAAGTLAAGCAVLLGSLLADLLGTWIDPRRGLEPGAR